MKRKFNPEWRKREAAKCANCGIDFLAVTAEIKRGKGRCCSLGCSAALASIGRDQSGPNNNHWKGGIAGATKYSERKRLYIAKHPNKDAAHKAVTKALRRGELERLPCEVCGEIKTEGHHDDYSRPLVVRWLCRRHHREHHYGLAA